jgi:capsular polysaccharide biosynthesis protein
LRDLDLYHLFRFYVKHISTLFLASALTFTAGLMYISFLQTPMYKSEATLLLLNGARTATNQENVLLNNYIQLFKSRKVLDPVIKKNNLNTTYDKLVKTVTAVNDKNTEVIKISVSSDSKDRSKLIAEDAISSFLGEVQTLYGTDNVRMIDGASRPEVAYNAKPFFILALSALIGMSIAVIGLFVAYDFSEEKKTGYKDSIPTGGDVVNKYRDQTVSLYRRFTNASAHSVARMNHAVAGGRVHRSFILTKTETPVKPKVQNKKTAKKKVSTKK